MISVRQLIRCINPLSHASASRAGINRFLELTINVNIRLSVAGIFCTDQMSLGPMEMQRKFRTGIGPFISTLHVLCSGFAVPSRAKCKSGSV